MERRKFIIGAGALGAGISTAIGTGAFTSVEAERSFDISTAGDSEAYLRLQPIATNQYANTNGGTLSVTLDDVNQNAVTTFEDLFQVSNYGTQPVGFYVQDDGTEAVSFTAGGNSIEGSSNAVSLGVGEKAVVSVTVDTNEHSLPESYDNITVVADSSLSGTDLSDSNTVFVSQSDSQADFTSIQTAVDALADRTENTVLVAGEEFDEDVKVTTDGVSLRSQGGTTLTSGLDLSASDVTVSGFEFTGTTSLYNSGNTAIYVRGTSGHDIINNTFVAPGDVDGQSKGLLLQTNSDITGVRVANNRFDGYTQGVYQNAQNTAEYVGNTFANNVVGLAGIDTNAVARVVENVFEANTTEAVGIFNGDAEIHRNDFNASNAAGVNNYGSTTVDAQNNWWGTTNPTTAADAVNVGGADGPVNIEPIATEPFDTGTYTVARDGSADFTSIQAAIDAARPGETVSVEDGTYAGFQLRTAGITVESADGSRPTVDSAEGSAQSSRIINVKASGVTLRGFEIVGDDTSLEGPTGVTVVDSGTIENLLVRNVLTGVQFSSGSGTSSVKYTTVENAQVGVSPAGGSGHTVAYNDFTGVIQNNWDSAPEALGIAATDVTVENNNIGDGNFVRAYSAEAASTVSLSNNYYGENGEDGEVVSTTDTVPSASPAGSEISDAGTQ